MTLEECLPDKAIALGVPTDKNPRIEVGRKSRPWNWSRICRNMFIIIIIIIIIIRFFRMLLISMRKILVTKGIRV